MTRPSSKPPVSSSSSSSSTFWSSTSFLVSLFLAVPLIVLSVFVSIPQGHSNWFSLSSSSSSSSSTTELSQLQVPSDSSDLVINVNTLSSNRVIADENYTLLPPSIDDHAIKRYSRLERIEATLARARSSIREAALVRNLTSVHEDPDYVPRGPIYRNANAFHRSYLEMEKVFKIYVYEEGEPPIFHDGPCKSIYSTEGRFIHELEKGNTFRTRDPDEALVYFLPFSVVNLVEYLYKHSSGDLKSIRNAIVDYINVISEKHPFWNRSIGADHFMLSCHDWGPRVSSYVPHLFKKSIRILCNANTSEGFNPSKDVTLPEINLVTGETTGLVGGPSPSRRTTLAFYAGRMHGLVRTLLMEAWKGDPDVLLYDEYVPKGMSYASMLRNSKYCLCPSGYEVASPRVVEAIYTECVPVLISDGYVPPFSDVLNWNSFSVQIQLKDIPNLKKILMGISQNQYLRLQRRVKQVQRHFVINGPPKRFDVFHMTLHSLWLRRLNVNIHRP